MEFTFSFINIFVYAVGLLLPFLGMFCVIVIALGQLVGWLEGWSKFDAFYWSFITAFTVGYGDIRPSRKSSKILSIIIALIGIMFTGVVVAITVASATHAFENVVA